MRRAPDANDRGRLSRPAAADSARLDDPRLTGAIEEYLTLCEAGEMPNRREFLARFPEFSAELAACLDGLDFVHRVAPHLREQSQPRDSYVGDAVAGRVALGDFRIVRQLGRGGMGVVYEAEQLSLARHVALKVLPFAAMLDERQLKRFQNEARAAATLDHPNIVSVYSVGTDRGVHYYAMQLIDGQSMAEVIEELRRAQPVRAATVRERERHDGADCPWGQGAEGERGGQGDRGTGSQADGEGDESLVDACAPRSAPHSPRRETARLIETALSTTGSTRTPEFFRAVARLGIQAAEALDFAHQQGIVHRDVKPGNLMLDARGKLWVTDFGLAQIEDPAASQDGSRAALTASGDLIGTLRYMSPEQTLARQRVVDHRSDIYSLGASLYELLTLEAPFPAPDRHELLRSIAFDEPRPPRRVNKAIPAELEIIVLKAIAKDPAERYGTAQELADDLQRFQDDKPIRARRPGAVKRLTQWARRHKAVATLAAVVLMLGLAVPGALKLQRDRQRRETAQAVRESLAAADASIGAGDFSAAHVSLVEAQGRLSRVHVPSLANEVRHRLTAVEARLAAERRLGQFYELLEEFHSESLSVDQIRKDRSFEHAHAAIKLYRADESATWEEQPAVEHLTAKERAHLREAVFELLVLLADWQVYGLGKQTQPDDYHRAVELLTLAEGFFDPTRALYRRRSKYRTALGDEEAARADAESAAATEPSLAVDRYLLGAAHYRGEDWPKALDEFTQAVRLKPDHFLSVYHMGSCLMRLDRSAEAEVAFTACIALQPDAPAPFNSRAIVCDKQDKEDQALEDYQKAIERGEYAAYLNRGGIHARNGRWREAMSDYSRAIEMNPFSHTSYHNRANVYARQGDFQNALADFNKAIQLHPSPNFYCSRAMFYAKYNHPHEALADFGKAIALDPQLARAYRCRACLVYVPAGELDKAIEDLSTAITLEPDNPDHYAERAICYVKTQNSARAMKDYDKLMELRPNSVVGYLKRGLLLMKGGRYRDAVADADRAATLVDGELSMVDTYNAACVYSLASAQARQDDSEPKHQTVARAYADRAVTLLRQAVDRGWRESAHIQHMQKDTDLDPIREHPEFQALIKELAEDAHTTKEKHLRH